VPGFYFRFTHADGSVDEITCVAHDEETALLEAEWRIEAFAGRGLLDSVVLADGSVDVRPAHRASFDPVDHPDAPLPGTVRVTSTDGVVQIY
jgi:hypothetical protein